MATLETHELKKSFKLPGQKPIEVLKGVNLSVAPGEKVAIVGRSGAGKSTLLNILGGLEKPTSGTVTRPDNFGFVFQQYHLMPELTVLENVLLPTMSKRIRHSTVPSRPAAVSLRSAASSYPPSEASCVAGAMRGATGAGQLTTPRKRALTLLSKVGLADRLDHLPSELSGGEQQRVALARALVTEPELILADEPTGNLDAWTGAEILKMLLELAADSKAFSLVMVTHSPEAAAICDRTLTLEDGVLR